jgi:hypothetical protein
MNEGSLSVRDLKGGVKSLASTCSGMAAPDDAACWSNTAGDCFRMAQSVGAPQANRRLSLEDHCEKED